MNTSVLSNLDGSYNPEMKIKLHGNHKSGDRNTNFT